MPVGGEQLLRVENLVVATENANLVDGVSFEVNVGETVCLLGESGCGKSLTCLSVMNLLDPRLRVEGDIHLLGRKTSDLPEQDLDRIRGRQVAMIFQNPITSLNPIQRVGRQIADSLIRHEKLSPAAARKGAIELLDRVGISDPAGRFNAFPHEISGGMCQRVMIAMAIACRPRLLLADEPTTALDVTIQAQILELLLDLQKDTGMGLVFVTHDLGVVAELANRVVVMYSGKVVETATSDALFRAPQHPYTRALMRCRMRPDQRAGRLDVIEGTVPLPTARPVGCAFSPRCHAVHDRCAVQPPLIQAANGSTVACYVPGASGA
jgi:peptide/nickel transport system ATP-binding protein